MRRPFSAVTSPDSVHKARTVGRVWARARGQPGPGVRHGAGRGAWSAVSLGVGVVAASESLGVFLQDGCAVLSLLILFCGCWRRDISRFFRPSAWRIDFF